MTFSRTFRFTFGLVWAIDAALKWLPGFRAMFAAMLDQAGRGQPGWLHGWFGLWSGLPHWQATLLAYGTAVTETFLAIGLLAGVTKRWFFLFGAAYSLLVWATAEGFGGPYHSGSTDVGAGIIYVLVFLALYLDQPTRPVAVAGRIPVTEEGVLVPAR